MADQDEKDALASFQEIFFEKQESALCAVHALNNLLQGSFYTEIQLSEIALQLDNKEKELMLESGPESAAYLTYLAKDSSNVDDDGNFSVEVIKQCLQNVGLSTKQLGLKLANDLTEKTGFICNLHSHWYAIRKLYGKFYVLNSLTKWGPELIGEFYLSVYLAQLQQEGYSIYVIQGNYPAQALAQDSGRRAQYFTAAQVAENTRKHASKSADKKSKKPTTEEEQLKAVLAASLRTAQQESEKEEMERVLAMSVISEETERNSRANSRRTSNMDVDDENDMDEDLLAAIALSQQLNQ